MSEPLRQVYLLLVHHGNGVNATVYRTVEAARSGLYEYVASWWETEIGSRKLPADPDAAIEHYFEAVEDEHWDILPLPVEDFSKGENE